MKGPFEPPQIDVRVHDQSDSPGHHHRRLGDILDILARSSLSPSVCDQAASIFRRLAEAEGRVHGTPPEDIHFHEVGAVDAIVDITGACIGLGRLGVEAVHCSALPIGGGFANSAHGRIPIPAPGTTEPARAARRYRRATGAGDVDRAAILSTLADRPAACRL